MKRSWKCGIFSKPPLLKCWPGFLCCLKWTCPQAGAAQHHRPCACNLHCRAGLFTVELDKHLSINRPQPVTRQGANTGMQIICISESVVWPASTASLGGDFLSQSKQDIYILEWAPYLLGCILGSTAFWRKSSGSLHGVLAQVPKTGSALQWRERERRQETPVKSGKLQVQKHPWQPKSTYPPVEWVQCEREKHWPSRSVPFSLPISTIQSACFSNIQVCSLLLVKRACML